MSSLLKLYKESPADLRPSAPGSVVHIPIPAPDNLHEPQQVSLEKTCSLLEDVPRDEESFAKRYLATNGAVYFSKRKSHPRSLLWRVVDGNRVLELRPVDLSRSARGSSEAGLLLRFVFSQAIIPHGVALSDREDHDALSVFVLTADRQLYTMTVPPAFFRRSSSISTNLKDWCRAFQPAPLTFHHPHRIHATNPHELFIALENGTLLRLRRRVGDDGTNWSLITFDEKPWALSLRSLLRFDGNNFVEHDGRHLALNTSNAIAVSPDETFVLVINLDHTLKIWNLASQRLVGSADLLGRTDIPRDCIPETLNPSETAYIRVFNAERATEGDGYYVLTYSPYGDGQFKFWAIRGGILTDLVIEDLFPHLKLKPADPDPSGSVFWNVADFQIKSADEGRQMVLWVLWRNNNLHQVYSLHFDLMNLEAAWKDDWTVVTTESRREEEPPVSVAFDVESPTEQWTEFLFHPYRYTPEALATSMSIYQEVCGVCVPSSVSSNTTATIASIKQQICSSILKSVSVRRLNDGEVDFAKYRKELDSRWRQFWQILEDISMRQSEALSLSYDSFADIPYLLFSNRCHLIRECGATELLWHNKNLEGDITTKLGEDHWSHRNLTAELTDRFEESSALLELASAFRKSFSPELHRTCHDAVNAEIFAEPVTPVPERVALFHERARFSEFISDDMFDAISTDIDNVITFDKHTSGLFLSIIDTLFLTRPVKDIELVSTDFGRSVVASGVMEAAYLNRSVLLDLLMLVVFIEVDFGEDQNSFDGNGLYATVIDILKGYEMINWLGSNTRPSNEKFSKSGNVTDSPGAHAVLPEPVRSGIRYTTILEDIYATHIRPRPIAPGIPQAFALTNQIGDTITGIMNRRRVPLDTTYVYVQCDLLAKGNIALASDFLRFQPNTPWATYVKGRLYLARYEYDTAAIYFQKASYLLSQGKPFGELNEMSSRLIDPISVNNFYNGLPKYFQHILSLFEQAQAFTHVTDFAQIALQALEYGTPSKDKHGSSPDINALQTDLLSRLFHASLKTSRFDLAYSALARHTNAALQKSALTSLITSILTATGSSAAAAVTKILHLPLTLVPGLNNQVDAVLLSLATKQNHQPSSLSSSFGHSLSPGTPDYERILQAYRLARHDLRGAAEVGYMRIERLQAARSENDPTSQVMHAAGEESRRSQRKGGRIAADDAESQELRHELLALINLLACMEKSEAYILITPRAQQQQQQQQQQRNSGVAGSAGSTPNLATPQKATGASAPAFGPAATMMKTKPRRIIVTLDDLRREYQTEVERVDKRQLRGPMSENMDEDGDEKMDMD